MSFRYFFERLALGILVDFGDGVYGISLWLLRKDVKVSKLFWPIPIVGLV